MRKFLAIVLFLAGAWMLISPQALTGLAQLKWMASYSFAGEVLVGIVILAAAYWLFDFPEPAEIKDHHH